MENGTEQVVETPTAEGAETLAKPSWKEYWREAARLFQNARILAFAALICALRIAVKAIKIPAIPGGLSFTFDAYVNALGSLVYGPLVALGVGAISDTIGAILFPSGDYFFPFIFVEMSSSFIFALFFWKKKLSVPRVLLARFTVSFACNIILTSLCMKWMYAYFAWEGAYPLINALRIVKNLVMFPLESVLLTLVLNAFLPVLRRFGYVAGGEKLKFTKKNIVLIAALTVLSVALVLFYVFYLHDVLVANNIKFW